MKVKVKIKMTNETNEKERDHWEDQDVGGWTILKLILER
jgi:hypothetical protein